MIHIYLIIDVATDQPIYVGASNQLRQTILGRHMTAFKGRRKQAVINRTGLEIIFVDEAATITEASKLEQYWFHQMRSWGFTLDNTISRHGGTRQYNPSNYYLTK